MNSSSTNNPENFTHKVFSSLIVAYNIFDEYHKLWRAVLGRLRINQRLGEGHIS